MRILNISEFGLYSYSKTLFQYFDYAHLGSRFAMDRFVPVSTEKKSVGILHICMFNSVIFSIVLLFCLFFFSIINNFVEFFLCLAGISYALTNIYIAFKRNRSDLKFLVFYNQIIMIFPIILALFFIFIGICNLSFIVFVLWLSQAVLFLFMAIKFKFLKQCFTFPKKYIKRSFILYKVGVPLFVGSFIGLFSMTVDRLLLRYYFGYHDLAIYSAILYVFSFMMLIPNILGQIFSPGLVKGVREGRIIWVYKSLIFLMVVLIPFMFILFVFVPMVIPYLLPKYSSYTQLMSYSSFILVPYALTFPFNIALNAIDMRNRMLGVNVIVCLIYVIFLVVYFKHVDSVNYLYLLFFKLGYGVVDLVLLFLVFIISFKKFVRITFK